MLYVGWATIFCNVNSMMNDESDYWWAFLPFLFVGIAWPFFNFGLLVLGNRYKAFWATIVLASVTAVSVILAISAVVFAASRTFSFPVIAVSLVYVFLMVEAMSVLMTFMTLRFFPKVFDFVNANSENNMSYSSSEGLFGGQDDVHTAGSNTGEYKAPDMGGDMDDEEDKEIVAEL
jgi:hypothetical protein